MRISQTFRLPDKGEKVIALALDEDGNVEHLVHIDRPTLFSAIEPLRRAVEHGILHGAEDGDSWAAQRDLLFALELARGGGEAVEQLRRQLDAVDGDPPPLNVWVVVGVIDFHGDSPVGVRWTARDAEEEAERLNREGDRVVFDGGYEVRGPFDLNTFEIAASPPEEVAG